VITLDLTLFGGFAARAAESTLTFPTRKAQALLSYLALAQGRAFERAQLCTLLWGEAGPEQAQSSLRQTLFTMRKVLPEPAKQALICSGRSVALDPTHVRSDVSELQAILARPERAALQRVAALYRGPLLDSLALDEPAFDEWLRVEQSRLAELATGALAQLAELEAQAGSLDAALQTRLSLSRLAPWDEDNHRELMLLYARQGKRSLALAQYKACVEILQRELGVSPELATQRLYRELTSPAPPTLSEQAERGAASESPKQTTAALSARQLSAALPLVRRERELLSLQRALAASWAGAGKVALLVGEAGVGKTSLVDALAHQVRADAGRVLVGRCFESEQVLPFAPWLSALRDAALFGSALENESLWRALSPECRAAFARLLPRAAVEPGGFKEEQLPPQNNALNLFEGYLALLAQLSQDAPLLVVLDDLHWADDMSLRLLSFLGRRLGHAKSEALRIFIAVTLRTEEVARSPLLSTALGELTREDCALELAIAPLSESDTSCLVQQLTETQGRDLAPDERAQIWRLSEGNPFVIVETVRALRAGAPVGEPSGLSLPARVRELIAGHVARLSPFEQQLTALAAVIGREFDLPLLTAMAEHAALQTAAAVDDLVRVGIFKTSGEKLYFSHERIREVVYESLLPPRRRALHGHVARTLLSLHQESLCEVYARLAFHFAKADERRDAVTYLAAFADHAAASFGVDEALSALADARRLAHTLVPRERTPWLLELDLKQAKCLFHSGRFAEIAPCLSPHLPLLDTLQRPELTAQVHFWLGCASGLLGDTAAAASGGAHALEVALRCGGLKAARRAHTLLAWEAAYAGRFEKGIEHGLAATVSLSSADAEVEYQAAGFLTAGLNYLYLGREHQARAALTTASALSRENGVARVQALSLGYEGLLEAELGNEAAALAMAREGVALAPDLMTKTGTLSLLLHVQVRVGQEAEAQATFAKLVTTAEPLAQRTPQGGVLIALAEAQLMAGQVVEAQSSAREALSSARAAGHPLIEGAALRVLGQAELALGDLSEAEAHLAQARSLLARLGAAFQLARTLCALSALARAQGDRARERRIREEAEQLYHELALPKHAARVAQVSENVGYADPSLQPEPAGGAPTFGQLR
jgi:DNA-binding SARP family transcriptional activator/energy-coupling factor transporter ATP-binding protein EcfA2